ncbi:ribonucleotide-diphosphate reductase subunit beta [Conexibacter sp. JD483]|uniref:ribonucleotide-diphosphate reductase subunit beta n=1 Tax=unclassified Conexibacter TaxID=2627773 RepID=UPI0027201568|nr:MULTISPECIES: ribonucleotide-diphosphate reductase subunit beta [unclassified Conexibacter]MDO8185903.1 ribonucleotide-diphosphate reductase subunit beta [Conexibacter sp. CPCC 205706]MDO8199394.1 ribonucleotide-diphosphate reductase subunit beta [Conexibacter sp. CPCC 205762]MDR9371294.1 ribonucleotide-diphosphate reductase subunit beta [Conexibacter sp. JD483]
MAVVSATEQISYTDLYARWERGNWSATEIDFSADREQWQTRFGAFERRAALFNYSLFFHGEDAVADTLTPYIDAAPLPEQKYFLTTQQVDEARHAVFFKRFMHEVAGVGDGTMAGGLAAIQPQLTWGFRKVFERLDQMADELRRDRSKPRLAAAIALYHLIVEATLAQSGQHFITGYLEQRDMLPGFYGGMRNVELDEQRHIGFGVRLLYDLNREDPDCREAVEELLREVLPWALAVFVPPGWDERYVGAFGFELLDIYELGIGSLDSKLRAAGMPLEQMRLPLPSGQTPRERAAYGIALLRAGYLGEKLRKPATDRETLRLLFDGVEGLVDHRHAPARPVTLEWQFRDAEPWHLRIDNGRTRALPGAVDGGADLTFHCTVEDWVDVAAGRVDPRVAMLRGRLRPRGSLRLLARMPKLLS